MKDLSFYKVNQNKVSLMPNPFSLYENYEITPWKNMNVTSGYGDKFILNKHVIIRCITDNNAYITGVNYYKGKKIIKIKKIVKLNFKKLRITNINHLNQNLAN